MAGRARSGIEKKLNFWQAEVARKKVYLFSFSFSYLFQYRYLAAACQNEAPGGIQEGSESQAHGYH